jgi:hypothetical protein
MLDVGVVSRCAEEGCVWLKTRQRRGAYRRRKALQLVTLHERPKRAVAGMGVCQCTTNVLGNGARSHRATTEHAVRWVHTCRCRRVVLIGLPRAHVPVSWWCWWCWWCAQPDPTLPWRRRDRADAIPLGTESPTISCCWRRWYR